MELSEEEKKAIETLETEGTENNYLEVKILLNLVEKLTEEIKIEKERNALLANNNGYFELKKYIKDNYIRKDKIKSIINNFRKVKSEILSCENVLGRASITYDIVRNDYCEKMLNQLLEEN